MTVGEMRRIMLEKIVPESVVPQNMVNFLIDENAELPDPDAYTFLNRLRSLGIGSADFVYLLEGCGAPKAAVNKIKANPAMNLQGLILTLESSGMTAKDYTRILYTARQIWERTLTLRLETSERISEGEYPDENAAEEAYTEYEEPSFEKVMDITMTDLNVKAALNGEQENDPKKQPGYSANISATGTIAKAGSEPEYEPEPEPEYEPESGYEALSDATEELMSVDFDSFDTTKTLSLDQTVDLGREVIENAAAESAVPEGIPEVGVSRSAEPEPQNIYENHDTESSSQIPSAEPFEVHIASYDEPFEEYENDVKTGFTGSFDKIDESCTGEIDKTGFTQAFESPDDTQTGEFDQTGFTQSFDSLNESRTAELEKQRGESEKPALRPVFGNSDEIVAASPEDLRKKNNGPFKITIDYGSEEPEVPRTPAARNVQSRAGRQQQYNGETTMIVPIDQEAIKEDMARLADNADHSRYTDGDDPPRTSELPRTAKQAPKKKRVLDDNDHGYDDDDDYDRPRKRSGGLKIHKGAIIAAAVAAVALIVINIAISIYVGNNLNKIKVIDFAKDATAVFTDIYYSHRDEIPGGENVLGYHTDRADVFGDLLICSNGLGAFSSGNNVYSVLDNKIITAEFADGELTERGRFEPAEGTHFVAAFIEDGGALIAVYASLNSKTAGIECGYLKIQGSEVLYTVRQDGRLTDLAYKNGEVKLGSVFTPSFYETFNAEKTEVYLPKTGIGDMMRPIEPEDVILSGTKGYSYALAVSYNMQSGAVSSAKAAMGNPIYASADGRFIMNGSDTDKKGNVTEYGLLINAFETVDSGESESGKIPLTEKIGKVSCAAFFENGCAVYENGVIVLRDNRFNTNVKALGYLARIPTSLKFSGNTLIASDENGAFLAADCSNISAQPVIKQLTQVSGISGADAAVTLQQLANGVKITRYMLENGAAREVSTFTRELPDEQVRTLVCGTANAMIARRDCCGAAYSYFDGVSVISEFVTLSDASETATLFDDKTGFEYAFEAQSGGKVYAVCSKGAIDVTQKPEGEENPA